MATDIHPAIMGPHALASLQSRMQALKAYGISPKALELGHEAPLPVVQEKTKKLAKVSKAKRALAVQSDHDLLVI